MKKNKKKKLITNKELPQGYIVKQLLEDYTMGIITVIFRKELLKIFNLSFNPKYNIIGDFDFNIKLSQKVKCSCIQKPLAFYRVHGENYSLKNQIIHQININITSFIVVYRIDKINN